MGLVLAVVVGVVPAAGAEPPSPVHDPAAVRELAEEILDRQEFQPPEPTLLDRIADWIGDRIDDVLPGSSDGGNLAGPTAGAGGSSVLTSVLLVLAVVAVGWIIWRLFSQPRRRRVAEEEPPTEIEVHHSAEEWAEQALGHEAEGRWKDGLRCRFRALVERLADEGLVPERAGRTSGELRLDVADSLPAAADAFGRAADLFERAWYGDLPTGAEEATRFADAAAAVLAEAGRHRSRPAADPVEVGA